MQERRQRVLWRYYRLAPVRRRIIGVPWGMVSLQLGLMKFTVFVMTVGLLAPAYAADQLPRTEFTRADPALRRVKHSDSYESDSSARWVGNMSLTGSLVVEFDRAPPGEEQPDVNGEAYFEPDKKSLTRLPAAKNFYPLVPKVIFIGEGGRAVLAPLIGRSAFNRLQAGSAGRYEFPATLVITELVTEVECDHRYYRANYKFIQLQAQPMSALLEAKNLGC
jgi:hypothetical protein